MDASPLVLADLGEFSPSEYTLAQQLAESLNKHYPGFLWAVQVNERGGIANVMNLSLSGRWGFRVFIRDLISATAIEHKAMHAGGELLERYRQRRGAANNEYLLAEATDFAGNLIPDL